MPANPLRLLLFTLFFGVLCVGLALLLTWLAAVILLFVGLTGSILVLAWEWLPSISKTRSKSIQANDILPSNPTDMSRMLMRWLSKAGWQVNEEQDAAHFFNLGAVSKSGFGPIRVGMLRKEPGSLVLWITFGVVADSTIEKTIARIRPKDLNDLARELVAEMTRYGSQQRGIEPPFSKPITLYTHLPVDRTLTEFRLFERLNWLMNAVSLYQNTFASKFDRMLEQASGQRSAGIKPAR